MRRAAWLFVLAGVGQACALRLIDAVPYAVYQHYRPWAWLVEARPLAVWGVLAQLTIVAFMLRRATLAGVGVVSSLMPWPRWLVVLALAAFSLAVPTLGAARSAGEMVIAGSLALLSAINLLLAVMALPESVLARAAEWLEPRVSLGQGPHHSRRYDRVLPVAAALWVTLAAGVTAAVVTERVPHIDDGVSYLFQAKYFAAGRLFLPAPPDASSFQVDQVVVTATKWYGYGFPGWPAVLALGVLAGVPWLVNPILGGLMVLVGHALVRHRLGWGTANVTVLLLAASPWVLFMSAEFMPHPLSAVLAVVAVLGFDRALDGRQSWAGWAALAGLAVGALMLTRAIDAALVTAAIGVAVLVERRRRRALRPAATAAAMAVALGVLILPYNQALTGRATYPPHVAWSDQRWGPGVDRLGFGPNIGIQAWPNLDPLPGHGVPDVVLNANKNLFMTNVDLFGWTAGSLAFVWLALGLGRWRSGDSILLTLPAAFIVGYSTYWFSGGPDIGARYWYPLVVPFAALTVRGAQMAVAALGAGGIGTSSGMRVGVFILAASLSATATFVPWRAVTKHYRYRGIDGDLRELAASRGFGRALVFVRSDDAADYQSAFNLNPAALDDPSAVFARDVNGASRAAVVAQFPDRPVWVVDRPKAGEARLPWRVIDGPLPPGTLPAPR
jgi:hypothetical protein